MTRGVRDILGRTAALLLDFDGPICAVFAGYPAPAVADKLRAVIAAHLGTVPADLADVPDPLRMLRPAADLGDPELTRAVTDACRHAEVSAVATAAPTLGAHDVLRTAHDGGRRVVIVSNNSAEAVQAYLHAHDLSEYVDHVAARYDGMDPRLLKPDTHLVDAALTTLGVDPAGAVLVGDSESDIEAGQAAGTATIGYANKPGKRQRLADAGADTIVSTMIELADAIQLVTAQS
jgi:HAD superfamily hydrolase (TIGR01509 family)